MNLRSQILEYAMTATALSMTTRGMTVQRNGRRTRVNRRVALFGQRMSDMGVRAKEALLPSGVSPVYFGGEW